MARLLDGKDLARRIRDEVRLEVAALRAQGVALRLQVALVGDDGPSALYVASKEKACADVGIATATTRFPAATSQQALLDTVRKWNDDPAVHGILVQLPLPAGIESSAIITAVDPAKDVDGLNPANLGRILTGEPYFYPATPSGILELLRRNDIPVSGRHVVILGRGELVGKPLANMLLQKKDIGNATVTVCHTRTHDIGTFMRQADILIAAAGRPHLVKAAMVRPGATVIDVGANRISTPDGSRVTGDVDFAEVEPIAGAISPVPGGVGPMTVAMLLVNTVKAAKNRPL